MGGVFLEAGVETFYGDYQDLGGVGQVEATGAGKAAAGWAAVEVLALGQTLLAEKSVQKLWQQQLLLLSCLRVF